MLRFTVRRLGQLIPILLGLSIILFAWIRQLPGGPAVALLGERATPEKIAQVNKIYGLDRPIWEQYTKFLGRLVRGDLGVSVKTQRPVMTEWWDRFPATVELSVTAGLIAVVLGVGLGYGAARRHGTWLDSLAVSGSLLGVAIPVFFLGYVLKHLFAVKLGWLPASGRQDPRLFSDHPTGFYVLDGIVTGRIDVAWDAFRHLVLPALALATIPLAVIARITRAAVLDVVHEDYVRTAEAKGLTKRTITRRHVLRNALLPVATVTGLQVGLLLAGAVLTETTFGLGGIGSFLVESIKARDYSVIQGFILMIAVIVVSVNLLVDISYGLIDPRVRVK
ncbi:MAG: ABC transporter permease [Nocardioides sp.]